MYTLCVSGAVKHARFCLEVLFYALCIHFHSFTHSFIIHIMGHSLGCLAAKVHVSALSRGQSEGSLPVGGVHLDEAVVSWKWPHLPLSPDEPSGSSIFSGSQASRAVYARRWLCETVHLELGVAS